MRKILLDELIENFEEQEVINNNTPEDYFIKAATPLSISSSIENHIISLHWLCKTASDKLVIISCNYIIESDDELSIIEKLPFYNDNYYLTGRIASNMLLKTLPLYVFDNGFEPASTKLNDSIYFETSSIFYTNGNEKQKHKFIIPNDIFASMAYIDNYIMDNQINNYETTLSIITSASETDCTTKLVDVKNIKSVLSITAGIKRSTSVGVLFMFEDENGEEYTLLAPFNVGCKFPKSKFKGNTFEKISDNYFKDKDQYISLFMFDSRIKVIDKEYTLLRAKNKDNEMKIFALDANRKQILQDLIKEF